MIEKKRAPLNRTLSLAEGESDQYGRGLLTLSEKLPLEQLLNHTIHQDMLEALAFLPHEFVDLLILDPPYNLTQDFEATHFKQLPDEEYAVWVETWLAELLKVMKPSGSVYVCCDWRTSAVVYPILKKHLLLRNRITWEREKGRGAKANWKNSSEDIWFGTLGDDYTFNVEAVKLKRRVMAPYRSENGQPKDWHAGEDGNYRLTHPSNLWTDITVPFWSMPENTDHPTQKPEKLIAKLILASSSLGDVVFDPFLGSGTSSVVAKKLGRSYLGIEREFTYCCLAEKRLHLAENDPGIQGYSDGVFWERNSLPR